MGDLYKENLATILDEATAFLHVSLNSDKISNLPATRTLRINCNQRTDEARIRLRAQIDTFSDPVSPESLESLCDSVAHELETVIGKLNDWKKSLEHSTRRPVRKTNGRPMDQATALFKKAVRMARSRVHEIVAEDTFSAASATPELTPDL